MHRLAYRNYGDHESSWSTIRDRGFGRRRALVRDYAAERDTGVYQSALRARLQVPLDGQHRDGQGGQHRARVQYFELLPVSRLATRAGPR